MEISNSTIEPISCNHCENQLSEDNFYCPECGYPQKGDEKDVAKFYANRAMEKNKHMDADEKINSARNTLFVLAGIVVLFGAYVFFVNDDIYALIINFIICCMYILLGFWSKEKPLIALLLGLLLYVTIIIISAIIEPISLFKGILWKVIIIAYLGKGIYSASAIKKTS